ncbi:MULTISPECIES: cell-envelope stress modulator CpxP [Tatumella]|uniref:Cell-envelope stress modulator CpxP n=1 Tax=Tatumella punctata TaxID=399969 RepID=A0ABW1VPP3_9GAMM|nr:MULTISPECIES: cell-envelope stress modulator CpxP [unclassified Tatumella]MBS0856597.1 Spy/CpxP family protein refolding chaperone [Tatumella sp. JGM16]MBS0877918.1 Spy/CpxP family protein refolding chaperone [Tatumella sp. JGM82]MBS0891624.1 Spy/CpxP family protein refolding chaperone [Tatumella sp. JGM94]MBS0893831.1 Spy/CpxP family protein refolding chaperone [Tatumella sp. JGM130]MBS0902552.1 Spy/CpxP family protein refolding chaperone [Tatumella sp. JGM100]
MRHLIIVALSSLVFAGQATAKCDGMMKDKMEQQLPVTSESMAHNSQNHMFDGIELSEQQRQQMRDLMYQARQARSGITVSDIELMHKLETARDFNEPAVRAQAEKMAEINEQVAMARVRHQMYNLLTAEQQAELQKNFELRMNNIRSVSQLP